MESTKSVLTPQEVADRLGVSIRLVYRQIKRGSIPCVRVGDLYLTPVVQFEAWLAGKQTAEPKTQTSQAQG